MKQFLYLAVFVVACGGGSMAPGERCGSCHAFGAAGTVYAGAAAPEGAGGATVEVTDSSGRSVSVVTNDAGNFYTTATLTPPLRVTVSRDGGSISMPAAPSGDCNWCHAPKALVPGRIHFR